MPPISKADLPGRGERIAGVADEREGGVAVPAVAVGVDQIEHDQVADPPR